MSNRFFITLLVLIAIVTGVVVVTKHSDTPKVNVQPTNHIEGSKTSGVTLVEYGDYQCPACGQYYPILKQVFETYKDKITFQFRNFPLVQLHPNAFAGARAAEAAGLQNKYWEMHDMLYENQQAWSSGTSPDPILNQYAQQLGLNVTKFKQDMASQQVNDLINADIKEAQKINATGTPTFVLDGKKIDNPQSVDAFGKVLDAEIAKKAPAKK